MGVRQGKVNQLISWIPEQSNLQTCPFISTNRMLVLMTDDLHLIHHRDHSRVRWRTQNPPTKNSYIAVREAAFFTPLLSIFLHRPSLHSLILSSALTICDDTK